MKTKVEMILNEFINKNDKPFKNELAHLSKDSHLIANKSKLDDFIFYWNKAFLDAYRNKKVELISFPKEIQKISYIWLYDCLERIKVKAIEIKNLDKINEENLNEELKKIQEIFVFLNLKQDDALFDKIILKNIGINKSIVNKISKRDIVQYTKEDILDSEACSIVNLIYFLAKGLYFQKSNDYQDIVNDIMINLFSNDDMGQILKKSSLLRIEYVKNVSNIKKITYLKLIDYKENISESLLSMFKITGNDKISFKQAVMEMLVEQERSLLSSKLIEKDKNISYKNKIKLKV